MRTGRASPWNCQGAAQGGSVSADMLGGAAAKLAAFVRALWGLAARDDFVSARIRRGQEIVDRGDQIKTEAPNRYAVRAQSKDSKTYTVEYLPRGWSCGCPDHQNRKRNCKHIYAVIQHNTDTVCSKAGMDAPEAHAQELYSPESSIPPSK